MGSRRRLATGLAALGALAVALAVVAPGGGSTSPAPERAREFRRGPAAGVRDLPLEVALSKDAPIADGSPIRAPSEPKERPGGPLAFVLDQGSGSLYDFDLARRRFLGPAPRLAPAAEKTHLPGYPTDVGHQPPQDIAMLGSKVVVAGGIDGTVILVPWDEAGLGTPEAPIELPEQEVRIPARHGGGTKTNGGRDGKPDIAFVSPIGAGLVLAVSQDRGSATSVAYLVDPVVGKVLSAAQVPGDGRANAVRPLGDGALVGMFRSGGGRRQQATGEVLLVNADLSVARRFGLPGPPSHLEVVGQTAYVSLYSPPRLVALSLADGSVSELARGPGDSSGPLAATPSEVWWAVPEARAVRHIRLADGRQRDLKACRSPSAMVNVEDALLVACKEGWLVEVPLDGRPRKLHDAGGFTYDVVLAGS